jgi:hypothetical protein
MSPTPQEYESTLAALSQRSSSILARSKVVFGAPDGTISGAVSMRLVHSAAILLESLANIPFLLATVQKEAPDSTPLPPRPPKKVSLEDVEKIKRQMIFAWSVTAHFGPDALRRSLPEYFSVVTEAIKTLLDAAEAALSNTPVIEIATELQNTGTAFFFRSSNAKRVLETYVKKSRGGRRGRLTLSIALMDDVEKLSVESAGLQPLVAHDAGKHGPNGVPVDRGPEVISMEANAQVHKIVLATLLPVTNQLFEKARSASPEADNPDRIAFFD